MMSKPIKMLQVSDTHLSRTHAYFWENWQVLLQDITVEKPAFVVHSGDVSFNGPENEDDIIFTRSQLDRIPGRWRAIAGNHDIGEAPDFSRLDQPVNNVRITRWCRSFGELWWYEDIGQWRVIGLDTAIMASGLGEEKEQLDFFIHALESRIDREAIVFVHMPPFGADPEDRSFTTSYIPHSARGTFLAICVEYKVSVIACGHLHIYNTTSYCGIPIIWAPTTAMVWVEQSLAAHGRVPRPGYIVWELDGRQARHTFVEPERMFMLDVTCWTRANGNTTTTMPPRRLAVR
jgi:3',5'-cyclic AMP phosphodiesterase CpdA